MYLNECIFTGYKMLSEEIEEIKDIVEAGTTPVSEMTYSDKGELPSPRLKSQMLIKE